MIENTDVNWLLRRPRHRFKDHTKIILKEIRCNKKGKAIPLQAWTDPEGSRSLRFPDFKTIGT